MKMSLKVVVFCIFMIFSLGTFVSVWESEGSDGQTGQPQEQAVLASDRYSAEGYGALSDDEKKDIYLNFPQRLPEDFTPEAYMDILHPEPERTRR